MWKTEWWKLPTSITFRLVPNISSEEKVCAAHAWPQFSKHLTGDHWDFVNNQVMFVVPVQFKCFDCLCRCFPPLRGIMAMKCEVLLLMMHAAIPVYAPLTRMTLTPQEMKLDFTVCILDFLTPALQRLNMHSCGGFLLTDNWDDPKAKQHQNCRWEVYYPSGLWALVGEDNRTWYYLGQRPKENLNEDSGWWHWGLYTTTGCATWG